MNNTISPEGRIEKTDYFTSSAKLRGLAMLTVIHTTWHFFLPTTCGARVKLVQVYPIEGDEEEPWMWCLDLDGVQYPLPLRQIRGPCPTPPDVGVVYRRAALLHVDYCSSLGPWFFGSMHPGMQTHPYKLYITRTPLHVVPSRHV